MANPQAYYDYKAQVCRAPAATQPDDDDDDLTGDPVLLLRVLNVPTAWAAALPEGELTTIPNPAKAAPVTPAGRNGRRPTAVTSPASGAAASVTTNVNRMLTAYGFTSEIPGGNSIGLIGCPRLGTPGAMVPEGAVWGHTAAFVRVNGRITVARGFVPESLVDAALNSGGVEAGQQAIAGAVRNDLLVFTNMGARAVEWPVSAQTAVRFANTLPLPGSPPPGGPSLYTGRPAVFDAPAQATNCVGWACTQIESALGGRVGTTGANGQTVPLTEPANPTSGLQGRFMQMTQDADGIASMPEAVGRPVVSAMPRYVQVLKWGGRVMILLGAGMVIYETVKAPEGQKARTFAGASGGFAGGLALGATAGLVCGPGALVCSVVLGLGFGLLGYYAGRSIAEGAYDAVNP
jgi:hypothetical protein